MVYREVFTEFVYFLFFALLSSTEPRQVVAEFQKRSNLELIKEKRKNTTTPVASLAHSGTPSAKPQIGSSAHTTQQRTPQTDTSQPNAQHGRAVCLQKLALLVNRDSSSDKAQTTWERMISWHEDSG